MLTGMPAPRDARRERLWRAWRRGDEAARAELIESLLPVADAASDVSAGDRDELRSAAYVAVVEAVERWDPDGGASLASFAWTRCAGAARDLGRRESRYTRATVPLDGEEGAGAGALAVEDRAMDPQAAAELGDLRRAVRTSVRRLAPNQRMALVAPELTGDGLGAAARELGVSTPRVARLRR